MNYRVLGPDGRTVAPYQEPNPARVILESDPATIGSARDCAEETVRELPGDRDQWRLDGSVETLNAGTRLRQAQLASQ